MIGSGIFLVGADMARTLGNGTLILAAWVLTGIITLVAALSYGELAAMMPEAGGQYVYIKRAFGNRAAFLYGWTVFTVIQTGVIAAVAVAFAKFTGVFFPALGPEHVIIQWGAFQLSAAQITAVVSICLLTWINGRGISEGKWVQRIFTFAKLGALALLILFGIYLALSKSFFSSNFSSGWQGFSFEAIKDATGKITSGQWIELGGTALLISFGTAMVGSLFSSDAWNSVTFIAGEIDNPRKNIPRSLLLGGSIVTILYLAANIAYLGLLPVQGQLDAASTTQLGISFAPQDRVGTSAAMEIFGEPGVWIMAALIMVSTFGCNNGIILAGSRLYATMAKDGVFFPGAAKLNKNGVPGVALWTQAAWASILCLSGSYGALLDYTIFASLLFYILTIGGIYVLRRKEPDTPRPYKVWGYPFTPAIYVLLATAIAVDLLLFKTENAGWGLGIVALGWPVYEWLKSKLGKVAKN